jgi:hypothetical protein
LLVRLKPKSERELFPVFIRQHTTKGTNIGDGYRDIPYKNTRVCRPDEKEFVMLSTNDVKVGTRDIAPTRNVNTSPLQPIFVYPIGYITFPL